MSASTTTRAQRLTLAALLATAAFSTPAPTAIHAQSTDLLALTGDPAPDANGSFSSFDAPVLNDAGQAAFFGRLTGTAGGSTETRGIFRSDGSTLTQIARGGQAALDANGTFFDFNDPVLNDAGQAAFISRLTGTAGGTTDDRGVFRGDGSTLTQIAREGQAAPDTNGTFSLFINPALNDAGQTAFSGLLTGTAGGTTDNTGIFRGDGSTLTQIVRKGQAAPDANGTLSNFNPPVLNDAGQVAFFGFLTGTANGFNDDSGVFRGDGSALTQIAREGQAAPDANGTFFGFNNSVALNEAGQAAFFGRLTGTAGGTTDDTGIFRGDGSTLTQIAREGQAAPDANGTFSDLNNPVLNDAGQAAFFGRLSGTAGGTTDDSGIFRGDGSTLTQIAREGQAAPDANGVFSSFRDPALNNAGQTAFLASLTDTAGGFSDNSGIYLFDDTLGLIQIAREGDPFLGSTITGLNFNPSLPLQDEGSGLNEFGQIAYRFNLADGRSGIALYTIPEPTSLSLLALGLAALTRRQHRAPR